MLESKAVQFQLFKLPKQGHGHDHNQLGMVLTAQACQEPLSAATSGQQSRMDQRGQKIYFNNILNCFFTFSM